MIHTALALRTVALAFWFGGGLATLLATSAVFRRAENRKVAGDIAGEILELTNVVRNLMFFVPAFAIVTGASDVATIMAFVCMILQALAVAADILTRRARRAAGGSIEALPPGDPRRKRFAALHGVAMLVLVLQIAVAGAGLALAS